MESNTKDQKRIPLVSVIMPCYNDGLYIHEAIRSVSKQTYCKILRWTLIEQITIRRNLETKLKDPLVNELLRIRSEKQRKARFLEKIYFGKKRVKKIFLPPDH